MEKYLFLDIDGVLTTSNKLENEKQLLLEKILRATGCKIVLSSGVAK